MADTAAARIVPPGPGPVRVPGTLAAPAPATGRDPGTSSSGSAARGQAAAPKAAEGAGWLGFTDRAERRFDRAGLVPPGRPAPGALLPRGTLLAEFRAAAPDQPAPLLDASFGGAWASRLTLGADAGGVALLHRQGAEERRVRLEVPGCAPGDLMRLRWTWDAPARAGALVAENLTRGTLVRVAAPAPLPLFTDEAEGLVALSDDRLGPGLRLLAVSDRIEPAGPLPGLPADALLMTPDGPRPVAAVAAGDAVLTRDRGWARVLWQGGAEVLARGAQLPVRFRAPFRGLARDLVVAPGLRLLAEGPAVDYLFGEPEVFLRAEALTDARTALRDPSAPVARRHQVLLDHHAVLWVSGLWAESLFAGGLARAPALAAATVLAGAPLPDHPARARRTLRRYEAAALRAQDPAGHTTRAA